MSIHAPRAEPAARGVVTSEPGSSEYRGFQVTEDRSRRPLRSAPRPQLLRAAAALFAFALLGLPAVIRAGPTMIPHFPYRAKEFAFFHDGTQFHLIYMRHDLDHDDSTEVDFGHAVSPNLWQWTQLDPILHVRPGKWDDLCVWSPTIVRQGDTYYLFYTGVTKVPHPYPLYQRIGVATSTDLVEWTRYDDPVFCGNQTAWAFADSTQWQGCQFRDPFVMEDPDTPGRWLMYFGATPQADLSQFISGIASGDGGLSPWQDMKPMWNTDAAHFLGFTESPCVFEHGGRWYLFFTTNSGHPIRFQHAASPTADSSGWVGNFRLYDNARGTDDWFGPEYLRVGEQEYFAAVNSRNFGIEIREMAWTGVTSFSLVTPPVLGVGDAPAREQGPSITGIAGANRALRFRVSLPRMMDAAVRVYDVGGRLIRVLSTGALPGGETVLSWDLRNGSGRDVATGVYLVRLDTPLGSRAAKARVLR
jgi:predicted GH43/DUF377 family glycosyl hydrolase